ncbi:MAG: MerR family transcriptional regulator [Candidatus Nanopelagicales bacterium]
MLISDFARLGQVSVRMLRHYDAIGLLVPASVDPSSGYRSYSPDQLHDLNRIVALKDLGFTLEQVRGLLEEPVGPDELRGMLRLRRTELIEEARAVDVRLTAVESRLRMIEQEDTMTADYVVKDIPAVRLVAQSRTMQRGEIGQHLESMFEAVTRAIGPVPGAFEVPVATYDETEEGLAVVVGFVGNGPAPEGCELVDYPASSAVCGVHLGAMDRIGESWQALHRWVVENGYEYAGPCREVYVRAVSPDQSDWVTELQQPVVR